MISNDMAWRLRRRGLPLNENAEYEDLETKQIAIRQRELLAEHELLDDVLEAKSVDRGLEVSGEGNCY